MNILAVNILEVCYDGELPLIDGFDENQRRVEICIGECGALCVTMNGMREVLM